MDRLPDKALNKICHYLTPRDRLQFQNVCKKTRETCVAWSDVIIVEVRDDEEVAKNAYLPSCSYTKPDNNWYIVKVTLRSGCRYSMKIAKDHKNAIRTVKNILQKCTNALYMKLWNAVLSDDFALLLGKFHKLQSLKLWNCGDYFMKKTNMKRVIFCLLSQPKLYELIILDSTEDGAHHSLCEAFMDRDLVAVLRGPISNLHLGGLQIPWRAFTMLMQHIGPTVERLSIGCIHGKELRREKYVAALDYLTIVTDLDLPPFIFYLNDRVPTAVTSALDGLFERLPLTSLGVRHYNTATLFEYIEDILPLKIRMLRIHHNASRLPNFAQLGNHNYEEPRKKISLMSRHSYLSSSSCEYVPPGELGEYHLTRNNSFIFPSSSFGQGHRSHRSSRGASRKQSATSQNPTHIPFTYPTTSSATVSRGAKALTDAVAFSLVPKKSVPAPPKSKPSTTLAPKAVDPRKTSAPAPSCTLTGSRLMAKQLRCNSTGSTSSSGSNNSVFGGRFQFLMRKSATTEPIVQTTPVQPGDRPPLYARGLTIFAVEERGNRTELKIRQKMFCGVSVVFTRECTTVQEVLGRMGSPLKSPHVYSKNANREIRIVKGDLVKPIPLTSLGMESDYDASDFEGEPEEKPVARYVFEFERERRNRERDYSKFRDLEMNRPFEISSF
ncbi:hypothetical protein L596_010897 [Steinernema carpocapsae]|uniref:F-box domain-containing protein n=1 Tax=Steinernema carpocapsae TaxID=34508 RepID=A0A4U5PKN2_STECR|nr:hypothetical protein L596_010897 [Steinernema carpocapsae]